MEYNLWHPVGQRVQNVQVRCANCTVPRYETLARNEIYGVLITDFLFGGGDGYNMIKNNVQNTILSGKTEFHFAQMLQILTVLVPAIIITLTLMVLSLFTKSIDICLVKLVSCGDIDLFRLKK